MQQVNMIQDAVTSPLRAFVNQVMGGMWRGEGANRFVAEMTNEVIPMLVNIMGFNTNFVGALKRAMDRMEQAERQASSRAQQLFDVFNKIF
jgi:hypothetical protein